MTIPYAKSRHKILVVCDFAHTVKITADLRTWEVVMSVIPVLGQGGVFIQRYDGSHFYYLWSSVFCGTDVGYASIREIFRHVSVPKELSFKSICVRGR